MIRIIKKLIRYILYIPFLPVWHLERLIPRDKKLWIFGSIDGNGYGDNARAFFEYMLLNHPEITVIWITRNKAVYDLLCSRKIAVCMMYSLKGIVCSLRAKYYFSDHGNFDLNAYTSNGAKKIHLWHGMPLKTIGYFNDEYYKKRPLRILKLRIAYHLVPHSKYDDIDLLTASSDFFKPFLASGFRNVYGKDLALQKIAVTGLPRNDNLFKRTPQKFLTTLRDTYKNCRVLFYMPTFRLGIYNNIPFSAFTGFKFDMPVFNKFLEDENIVFLFKPHPYDTNLPDFGAAERFLYLKGNEYDDLYEFLGNIDILVTDYSSVYFDFLLTGKPVILTPFDYDEYIKIRGLFFDYNTYMDGIKAYNWDEFIQIVKEKRYYSVNDNNLFNKYKDAASCERMFNAVQDLAIVKIGKL